VGLRYKSPLRHGVGAATSIWTTRVFGAVGLAPSSVSAPGLCSAVRDEFGCGRTRAFRWRVQSPSRTGGASCGLGWSDVDVAFHRLTDSRLAPP
jgi:hypothetical protein